MQRLQPQVKHSEPAADGGPTIRLKLLGTPSLAGPGQPAPLLLTGNDAALLAILATGGPQPRSVLAGLLWPEKDAATAATNLRQRIYRFKRMAGGPLVVGEGAVKLAAGVEHDLLDALRLSASQPHWGAERLLGAHEFADNEALAAWLFAQRESRTQLRVRQLSDAAAAQADQGDLEKALPLAQLLVSESPLSEPAHRLLIRLLHRRGDAAGAQAAYEHCVATLAQQLGIKPSADTRALLSQLQAETPRHLARAQAIPLSLLRPPKLVARDEHWQQISQAVANRQGLLIEGEAGMGKSRLLGDYVRSSAGWLLVAASPGDLAMPYALLARLLSLCSASWLQPSQAWVCQELARLAPEAGVPSRENFAALRLQQAVNAALLHWQSLGLVGVALDDLHYADPSSLELLLPLISGTGAAGLPWLLATRPPTVTTATAAIHTELEGLARLSVTALSMPDIQELLSSLDLASLRAELWAPVLLQRTGGNPLYLLQTLTAAFESQALHDDPLRAVLPASSSLRALLVGRLEKLSPAARAIARVASVAGPDFDLQLTCQLLQTTPAALADPWLELQSAHVMHDNRFAHDLIRDASAQITPTAVRQMMHAQVAAALALRQAPAARVAEHWEAAQRWLEAAQAYEQAAAQAHEHSAVADELSKLQAATRCHLLSEAPQAQQAAFVTEHRSLELRVAQTQLGADTQQSCEDLLSRAQNDEQRVMALVLLAHYWCERFEPERGLACGQSAMTLAQALGCTRWSLLAAQRVSGALGRLGRYDEAVECLRPRSQDLAALSLDERLNWRTDFGLALDYADQRQEALLVFEAVTDEGKRHGRWAVAAAALSLAGNALTYLGRSAQGQQAMEEAMVLHRRAGVQDQGLLIDEANYVGCLRDRGCFAAYLQRAERLPQALRDAGSDFWAANAEHDLATAYAWLGRADLALRTLAAHDNNSLPPLMQAVRLVTRARLARDFAVASNQVHPPTLLHQAQDLLAQTKASGRSHFSLAIAVMVARDAEPESALRTARGLEAEGLRRQNMMLACAASCLQLRLLLARGDLHAAAASATELLQRIQPHGVPAGIYPPDLWWLAYQALRLHQPVLAQATLRQTEQWLHRIAHDHTPQYHRESFLTRNPINRAVLAAAQSLPS